MGKFIRTLTAGLVLLLSIAQAGFFPVLPGADVFPFSNENAVIPEYPPLQQSGTIDVNRLSSQGSGSPFVLIISSYQVFSPDWVSHGEFLSRIHFPEVLSLLYCAAAVFLRPGLEPVQIIFPFHEFW